MLTALKLSLIHMIEAAISLPQKGYCVLNGDNLRLCYFVERTIKYVHFTSKVEIAAFFKKHDLIDYYTIKGEEVTMYQKSIITIAGAKGEPVQCERKVQVSIPDIQMNPAQVQWFCAYYEFERQNKVIGNVFNALKVV